MKEWIKFWKELDKTCNDEIIKKEYERIRKEAQEEIISLYEKHRMDVIDVVEGMNVMLHECPEEYIVKYLQTKSESSHNEPYTNIVCNTKYKAENKKTGEIYWFDMLWGNCDAGRGYIGVLPFAEEKKVVGHSDNRIPIDPIDFNITLLEEKLEELGQADDFYTKDKNGKLKGHMIGQKLEENNG